MERMPSSRYPLTQWQWGWAEGACRFRGPKRELLFGGSPCWTTRKGEDRRSVFNRRPSPADGVATAPEIPPKKNGGT